MNNLTEKEALYILRHRKEYTDIEIDKALNRIKRINSHRAEYIRRYKKRLKESIPKKKIEDKLTHYKNLKQQINNEGYDYTDFTEGKIEVLQELLEDK